jgi:hypothetical protein
MTSAHNLWTLAASLVAIPFATAAYDPSATDNIAIYWGETPYKLD